MSSLWLHLLITSGLAVCECVSLNCCCILRCQFPWERISEFISVCVSAHMCTFTVCHTCSLKSHHYGEDPAQFQHKPLFLARLLYLNLFFDSFFFFFIDPSFSSPLDSHSCSPLPLFSLSSLLCLWLTSSYLAGWQSESDIWIYYYTTVQVSSLRLSAPIAPLPCFSFTQLSGPVLPCACCPNRL